MTQAGFSLPMEKIVPFMPFLAVLGMTIDYSVLDPSPVWLGFIRRSRELLLFLFRVDLSFLSPQASVNPRNISVQCPGDTSQLPRTQSAVGQRQRVDNKSKASSTSWNPFGDPSVKHGTIQRRLAWPPRTDDARNSRSLNDF